MNAFDSDSKNSAFVFVVLLAIWWGANNLYALDAHILLARFEGKLLFVDLSFAQIIVGMTMAAAVKWWKSSHSNATKLKGNVIGSKGSVLAFPRGGAAFAIGFFHIAGTILTNSSYSLIGSTSTLVWKLTEPLVAVILKRVFLAEPISTFSLVGILTAVIGVMIFSLDSLSVLALSPIVIANIAFPVRNVLVKLEQKSGSEEVSTEQRFFTLQASSLPLCIIALTYKFAVEGVNIVALPYLFRNAVLFNAYQFASIALLEKMDSLTHSLANTMKRFSGIALSFIVLGDTVEPKHIFGLLLTVIGFPVYVVGGKGKKYNFIRSRAAKMFILVSVMTVGILAAFVGQVHSLKNMRDLTNGSILSGTKLAIVDNRESQDASNVPLLVISSESNASETPENEVSVSSNSVIGSTSNKSDVSPRIANPEPLSDLVVLETVRYQPSNESFRSYDEAMHTSSGNVGNMVWQYAGLRRLPDFSVSNTCSYERRKCLESLRARNANPRFVLYMPKANSFNDDQELRYEYISVTKHGDIPLMVGIGVQASFSERDAMDDINPEGTINTDSSDFEFSPGALKLLEAMEEKGFPIFFRGDFTLHAAQKAGYTYGHSTGCPSLMWNDDVRLGKTLEKQYAALRGRIGDNSLKIALNVRPTRRYIAFMKAVLERYPNSMVYTQGVADFIHLKRAGIPWNRTHFFTNIPDWLESLRTMDVAFGARIHGNMLSLAASIPVFVVAPDHRVLELVERMMIPHTTIFDKRLAAEEIDIAKMVSDYEFDGEEFDKNRCGIAKVYRKQFSRFTVGVQPHVLEMSKLC